MGPCWFSVPTGSQPWASLLPPGIYCVPALGQGSEGSRAGPIGLLFPLVQYRLGEESRMAGSHPQRGPGVRGEGLRGCGDSGPLGAPYLVAQAPGVVQGPTERPDAVLQESLGGLRVEQQEPGEHPEVLEHSHGRALVSPCSHIQLPPTACPRVCP